MARGPNTGDSTTSEGSTLDLPLKFGNHLAIPVEHVLEDNDRRPKIFQDTVSLSTEHIDEIASDSCSTMPHVDCSQSEQATDPVPPTLTPMRLPYIAADDRIGPFIPNQGQSHVTNMSGSKISSGNRNALITKDQVESSETAQSNEQVGSSKPENSNSKSHQSSLKQNRHCPETDTEQPGQQHADEACDGVSPVVSPFQDETSSNNISTEADTVDKSTSAIIDSQDESVDGLHELPELPGAPDLDRHDGDLFSTHERFRCQNNNINGNGSTSLDDILQRFRYGTIELDSNFDSQYGNRDNPSHFLEESHVPSMFTDSDLFFADENPELPLLHDKIIADDPEDVIVIKDESESDVGMDIENTMEDSPRRKNRNTTTSRTAKASNKTSVAKITKRKSRQPKQQKRNRNGTHQPRVVDLHGLLNSNIIPQATANQAMESQPRFAATNRRDALRQLVASLPKDQQDLYKGDNVQLDEAAKVFVGRGYKVTAMKADGSDGWLLKGMKSHLRHHQLLGAAFMRQRETEGSPNGGVLGDIMGFGKTVVCLANIIDGMPLKDFVGHRATLVVVPSALMSQWRSEIEKHVEKGTFGDVSIFGPKNRFAGANDNFKVTILGRHDIIITSYSEVMASYPINEPPIELTTDRARKEWWEQHLEENKGPLHRVNWYRVVLDESQVIKNHLSRTSIAVRALHGKFRWVLSGTPVLNNLKEWYPTLDFLKMPHIGRYDLFCRNFCRKGSEKALQRLQLTLSKIMLRRTHKDRLFGRPIIKLPEITEKTIEVTFNSVERAIYTVVLDRFCKRVSPLGLGEQNYRSILVLLLRLRQLVGHPLLIQKTFRDLLETEDLDQLWSLTEPAATGSCQGAPDGSTETALALACALDHHQKLTQERAADNKLSEEYRQYLQALNDSGEWAKINQRSMCHACGDPPDKAMITQCKHIYCKACLNDMAYEARSKGKTHACCFACGTQIIESATWYAKTFTPVSKKQKSLNASPAAEEDTDWFDLDGPMLRSAKVRACTEQLQEWFSRDITNKVIIFVQFRGLIQIFSRIFEEEDWDYETFDGTMSFDSRNKAIAEFSEKRSKRILIAALKAGGIGLNLTAANKIVIIDVWWNHLTEEQAFSRAYRMGQERNVEVVRFVVKNTVDTKIVEMQKRKTQEIDSALKPGSGPRLTQHQLNELWAELSRDREAEKARELRDPSVDSFISPNDPYDDRIHSGDVIMSGTT